jgi:hypothetical protein
MRVMTLRERVFEIIRAADRPLTNAEIAERSARFGLAIEPAYGLGCRMSALRACWAWTLACAQEGPLVSNSAH